MEIIAKILNFGSLNIDYVYSVDHFVRPGETLSSTKLDIFCGGKGLNQSIAMARAGATVYHAGMVGETDGDMLISSMEKSGVHTSLIQKCSGSSGHAMIQVDRKGQNCILLHGGANQTITGDYINRILGNFSQGDYIVLQNEINMIDVIIQKAKACGLKIVLNPSPMDDNIKILPLEFVDYIILNEIEAGDICCKPGNAELIHVLSEKYPNLAVVLTLGKDGVIYKDSSVPFPLTHGIYSVEVVDTTAAGDTFTGYFVAQIADGKSIEEALRLASVASSIAVSRRGAEPSIPYTDEVINSRLSLC